MASKSPIYNLARKMNNFYFSDYLAQSCLPFLCDKVQVGFISSEVLAHLKKFPEVFNVTNSSVSFVSSLDTPDTRSNALEGVLNQMKRDNLFPQALKGWRNECYVTRAENTGPVLFKMDRSATPLFGVRAYGVHITGYVQHSTRGLCVWFQKRSQTKSTWPGMFDTFVGGGIGEETGIMETAIKEAGEEANVPESLAAKVKPAGSVSLFFKNDRGILANTEYVFDLELPEDFVPSNNDGEVDSWVLVDVAEIPKLVCGDNFKTTSAAITIDWLIRRGFLTPETEPHYGDIIEMVHLPLTQLYRLYQAKSDCQSE